MEQPPGAESAFAVPSKQRVSSKEAWSAARSAVRTKPGCTGPTWLISNTSVIPPRDFDMQKCGDCGSEFLNPRPLESELPPFYPSDYHAYNENHSGVARLLVQFRSRSRARFYGQLIRTRPGRIFDVGTGDCRHFDELRRFLDLECAGIEIQPDVAAKGRARGYDVLEGTLESADLSGHVGRYDIVSMNHVLEHVVSPHTMLERAHDLLRPGGHVIGQLPTVSSWENRTVRAQLGWLPLPEAPADPVEVWTRRPPAGCRLHFGQDPVGAAHPDNDFSAEHARSTWVAPHNAKRQDTGLRRPPRCRSSLRNRRLVVRRGRHRQLPSREGSFVAIQ